MQRDEPYPENDWPSENNYFLFDLVFIKKIIKLIFSKKIKTG